MNKETKRKALLNTLLISKLHSNDSGELQQAINELRDEYKYGVDDIMSETGLSRGSVYSYLTGKDKVDKTQLANKLVKKFRKNLDFDVLTVYFRRYCPRTLEDRDKLKKLIAVLLDCVKR